MIISDKHRYVFIQNEMTGSSGIAKELMQNYGGRRILWKHAHYEDFLRTANQEQEKYFVFASVRNPLDVLVSQYTKLRFNDPENARRNLLRDKKEGRGIMTLQTYLAARKRRKIQDDEMSFQAYFYRYCAGRKLGFLGQKHYDITLRWCFTKLDRIMRFEQFQDDFRDVIATLSLDYQGEVPVRNKTREKDPDLASYYVPAIRKDCEAYLGESMRILDYQFPGWWNQELNTA